MRALDRVSMRARRGEFVSVLGPSGCGKSTLLMIAAGLLHPSNGVITVNGRPITRARTDIGIVFQNPVLLEWRTALGNVMLQAEAKKLGRPWDTAKGFDHSAPIGPIHPVAQVGQIAQGAIWLNVNGEEKQRSDISQLIWPVADTIAFLSTLFELKAGDLIYTGTPEGVGAVVKGDVMTGGVDGIGEFAVRVV